MDQEGGWVFGPLSPGKIKVAIFSLEILIRTPLEKQLDPSGPIVSRGRYVQPSVKYVDDKFSGSPLPDFFLVPPMGIL